MIQYKEIQMRLNEKVKAVRQAKMPFTSRIAPYQELIYRKKELEKKESEILMDVRKAEKETNYFQGTTVATKRGWENRMNRGISTANKELKMINKEIEARQKNISKQDMQKLAYKKQRAERSLQLNLKEKKHPPKRILGMWKEKIYWDKELKLRQHKMIKIQSELRNVYEKMNKLGTPDYRLYERKFSLAMDSYYQELTDITKKLSSRLPKKAISAHTLTVSVSRKRKDNKGNSDSVKLPPTSSGIAENQDAQATEQSNAPTSFQCSFDGVWDSYLGDIKLHQTGTTVQGKADYDSDVIEGNVKGNVMYGHWHKPDHSIHGTDGGDLILTLSEDCSSYSGKWRHGTEKNGDDFYGWHSWGAKRKARSKMAKTIKQPAVKKNQKEMRQDKLKKTNSLNDKLKNLQRQWDASLKQIDELRVKGEDVTDLKQNLMHIRVQQQQVRKHLEELNDK